MAIRWFRRPTGKTLLPILGAALCFADSHAQAPLKTKVKKVLVLEKSQGGVNAHFESRRDLKAALAQLAAEKGFSVTILGQDDSASRIALEFSPARLATYQAVLLSNNDGVHAQLDSASKANLEDYVRNGGGLVPVHAASAFIEDWPWMTSVIVESFYGPMGPGSQPVFDLAHDAEGTREEAETQGIFKGLTAPPDFLDEYYTYRASPRGRPGVTILLTADVRKDPGPIAGPSGDAHPVAWAKVDGKGRVVHIPLGHSFATNNVYAAKGGYLKSFLYGSLRYVAGDFVGCTDDRNPAYNPDATKSDPAACLQDPVRVAEKDGRAFGGVVLQGRGRSTLEVRVREPGHHVLRMLDVRGHVLHLLAGRGAESYSLNLPAKGGIYFIEAEAGGRVYRRRVTVL